MKDLLIILLQIIGLACGLCFIGWIFNYFFGFSVGFKGTAVPSEPQAGFAFFLVGAASFGVAYLLGRGKAQNKPD
jgi:hypothetical protein